MNKNILVISTSPRKGGNSETLAVVLTQLARFTGIRHWIRFMRLEKQFRMPPMKKIICLVLAFVLLFTITACGNNGNEENSDIKPEFSTNAPAPSDAEPEDSKESETEAGAVQTELQQTESTQENTEQEVTEMKIQIGDTTFTATLAENSSVDALKELMADGSLTLNMSDYANMEKGADLGVTLPQNNEPMNTQAGDIILYQGRTFVIYYDTNSWSLTPIGKIDNVDTEELREVLGNGDVTVTLSIE